MTRRTLSLQLLCALFLITTGCSQIDNSKANFSSAINDYYKVHPACLWSTAKKFPVQAATSDDSKTQGYDALTDSGLLTRTTGEKKVFIIASKQVNNYDVSDKGRAVWTQDPSQPGYGNFCYGHRNVTSIDTINTADTNGIKTATVDYHYNMGDIAAWANTAEMKTAFPNLDAATSSTGTAHTTLTMTGDHWQVTP